MGFSKEWDVAYKNGLHNSVWPWSDVVSLTKRYFFGGGVIVHLVLRCLNLVAVRVQIYRFLFKASVSIVASKEA